jgi:hypothetical protein
MRDEKTSEVRTSEVKRCATLAALSARRDVIVGEHEYFSSPEHN